MWRDKEPRNATFRIPLSINLLSGPPGLAVCSVLFQLICERVHQGFAHYILVDVQSFALAKGKRFSPPLNDSYCWVLVERVRLDHHNGTQFTSARYVETLNRLGITHRRAAYNHPEGNSYIERFHRSLKEEEVWLNEYQNFDQARQSIARWIEAVQSRPSASRTPRTNPARCTTSDNTATPVPALPAKLTRCGEA